MYIYIYNQAKDGSNNTLNQKKISNTNGIFSDNQSYYKVKMKAITR